MQLNRRWRLTLMARGRAPRKGVQAFGCDLPPAVATLKRNGDRQIPPAPMRWHQLVLGRVFEGAPSTKMTCPLLRSIESSSANAGRLSTKGAGSPARAFLRPPRTQLQRPD